MKASRKLPVDVPSKASGKILSTRCLKAEPMPAFKIGPTIYNNPVQLCLDHIGGKWKLPILWRLRNGKLRFSELKRSLNEHLTQGKVTDRTLSLQLKELEQSKLLTRKVYPEIPPRTEYKLTPLGEEVLPCLKSLQKLGLAFKQAMGAVDLDGR